MRGSSFMLSIACVSMVESLQKAVIGWYRNGFVLKSDPY